MAEKDGGGDTGISERPAEKGLRVDIERRPGPGGQAMREEAPPPLPAEPSIEDYEVKLRKVENGFIIHIGCKTFVENDFDKLSKGLKFFFEDPQRAYKKYCTPRK